MTGCIVRSPNLFEHDLALAKYFLLVEDRESHGVGQDIETLSPIFRGERRVIDGLIERGVGIDVAAQTFDVARDVSDASPLGAFEEHVLMEMSKAFFAGALVCRAHPGPDLKLNNRGPVTLAEQHSQTIRQNTLKRFDRIKRGSRLRRRGCLGA